MNVDGIESKDIMRESNVDPKQYYYTRISGLLKANLVEKQVQNIFLPHWAQRFITI